MGCRHQQLNSGSAFEAEGESGVEIVIRVGPECDVGGGRFDALHLGKPVSDDVREFLVSVHPCNGDQVPLTGD